jgi:hypothetical protein
LHLHPRQAALLCALMLAAIPILAFAAPLPGDAQSAPNVPPPIAKSDMFANGARGVDVSWPQCPGNQIPEGEANFVIIGVTGGKAFTRNECYKRQFDWATTGQVIPQVYTNVNGVPRGYVNPACEAADIACNSYHYGWDSATDAVNFARSQQTDPKVWWLDVETMNYWSPDRWTNAWVVRGAIEGLQSAGRSVGLYSTPLQWDEIVGAYAPGLPVWTAGAESLAEARGRCSRRYEFGGGQVTLVQYVQGNFDNNFACMPMPASPPNTGAQGTIPPATTPSPAPKTATPPTPPAQSAPPPQSAIGQPAPPPATPDGAAIAWPPVVTGAAAQSPFHPQQVWTVPLPAVEKPALAPTGARTNNDNPNVDAHQFKGRKP